MDDVLSRLRAVLDVAVATDPSMLADGEAIVALYQQLERLEAVTTRAAAAFDAGGSWAASGARTSSAWTAFECRQPVATTRRRLRIARSTTSSPGPRVA